MAWPHAFGRLLRRNLSLPGLALGGLLFAAALTPSLLPRGVDVQGLLSGCAFVFGYAIGAVFEWLWHYLGLGRPHGRFRRWLWAIVLGSVATIAVISLYWTSAWQDEIRTLMGMAAVEAGHPCACCWWPCCPSLSLFPSAR